MFSCISVSVYAADYDTEEDLRKQLGQTAASIEIGILEPGTFKPYTESTIEKTNNLADECISIAYDENSTMEDLQAAYDRLMDFGSYMYVDKFYAQAAYVLALEESNDNQWYDESDWNSFVQKREALRVALKGEDEKLINDAYRDMYDSFIVMTSRYNKAGDINKDGVVNVIDVTLIQKYLVKSEKLNSAQIMLAQCYVNSGAWAWVSLLSDEKINIACATKMQKCLADYDGIVLDESPNTTERFIYRNDFGDEFNFCIFLYMPDERTFWVDERIQELEAEDIL